MSTNNDVNSRLSGNTGTGNFVGSTSPTLITPTLGVAAATSLAFSPTTNGIIGTTSADNASSGYVGEFISSQITSGSAISLTTATTTNLTSISLTAGDWDVWGNMVFIQGAGTTPTSISTSITTVSATSPNNALATAYQLTFTASKTQGLIAPYRQININSTTTVYIIARSLFSGGTMTICGGIYARRIR